MLTISHRLPAWLTTHLAFKAGDRFSKVWVRLGWSAWSLSNPIERAWNSTDGYNDFIFPASAFSSILLQYARFTSLSSLCASLSKMHKAMMLTIRDVMIRATYISWCVIEARLSDISHGGEAREQVRLTSGWYRLRALYKLGDLWSSWWLIFAMSCAITMDYQIKFERIFLSCMLSKLTCDVSRSVWKRYLQILFLSEVFFVWSIADKMIAKIDCDPRLICLDIILYFMIFNFRKVRSMLNCWNESATIEDKSILLLFRKDIFIDVLIKF